MKFVFMIVMLSNRLFTILYPDQFYFFTNSKFYNLTKFINVNSFAQFVNEDDKNFNYI